MLFDILITTYNRPQRVLNLVNSLLNYKNYFKSIIVVDSSDNIQIELTQLKQVVYIRSSHKNQPYQRYLGYSIASSDWLLFLDDDMELVNDKIFLDVNNFIQQANFSGLAINFKDKHRENALSKVPTSLNRFLSDFVSGFIRKISFNNVPDEGKIGLYGQRGKQPKHLEETQILSGGAFLALKAHLFSDFNAKLLDLFEQRMGMGEDTLIGYGLSKRGRVLFYEPICFLHNDETGSNYSLDLKSYSARVTFSRLFIACEKKRLDNKNHLGEFLIYSIYVVFRLFGALASLFFSPSKKKIQVVQGLIWGYRKTFGFDFSISEERNAYWTNEVRLDVKKIMNHNS